jgi:hypothetical protein
MVGMTNTNIVIINGKTFTDVSNTTTSEPLLTYQQAWNIAQKEKKTVASSQG